MSEVRYRDIFRSTNSSSVSKMSVASDFNLKHDLSKTYFIYKLLEKGLLAESNTINEFHYDEFQYNTGQSLYLKPLRDKIEDLKIYYKIRNEEDVIPFLFKHTHLIDFIDLSFSKIKHYFKDSELFIDKFIDPEFFDDEHLVIYVRTSLDADTAFNRLCLMNEHWWFEHSEQFKGLLSINIEFENVI